MPTIIAVGLWLSIAVAWWVSTIIRRGEFAPMRVTPAPVPAPVRKVRGLRMTPAQEQAFARLKAERPETAPDCPKEWTGGAAHFMPAAVPCAVHGFGPRAQDRQALDKALSSGRRKQLAELRRIAEDVELRLTGT